MIFPSKVVEFEDSVIGKISPLLEILKQREFTVGELYEIAFEQFEDINQFILTIDVLYLLDAITYEQES